MTPLDTFTIFKGKEEIQLPFANILYMKAERNYISIVTDDFSEHVVRYTFTSILEQLPEALFVRIHRSFIINSIHLRKATSTYALINEVKIPVGRIYRLELSKLSKDA